MEITCRVYRPRDPRKTSLYGLLDSLYDRVKGAWEERFERSYGFWRGLVDEVVASYLACGLWQGGFARVRCRRCPEEFLVAFSCKERGVCPSCGAKRAAELAAFLQDEVVEQVGHAQWVFTIPKMLRVYFLHHRELLGALSLAAYETVRELMVAAVEENGFRPGMVSVVQTFGEGAKFPPTSTPFVPGEAARLQGSGYRCRMWTRERPRRSSATRCWLCSAEEGF